MGEDVQLGTVQRISTADADIDILEMLEKMFYPCGLKILDGRHMNQCYHCPLHILAKILNICYQSLP